MFFTRTAGIKYSRRLVDPAVLLQIRLISWYASGRGVQDICGETRCAAERDKAMSTCTVLETRRRVKAPGQAPEDEDLQVHNFKNS
jgi:hypothetical protein